MQKLTKYAARLKNRAKHLINFSQAECDVSAKRSVTTNSYSRFSNLQAQSLKELRVACVMDQFTLECYRPECNLFELTPTDWKKEIDSFRPELVFIESAWRGKDDLWRGKIRSKCPELSAMASYCHEIGIPVLFWCKEDPSHTDSFMVAARCADFVFTTDIDSIGTYKRKLGHNNVFFLHFAAQPAFHNPIEKYERKDKFCFAGSYYHQYPERMCVFDSFANVFMGGKGLDIYDRNYNRRDTSQFIFPDQFQSCILGTLDFRDIDVAYKAYLYGITMNSMQQSQTMFARRAFELMASNTIVVGNYSRGLKNILGDFAICTDDVQTLKQNLAERCSTPVKLRKYRLLGLRKVLAEHLYEDRLDFIVQKIFGVSLKQKLPLITCISSPEPINMSYVLDSFRKQTYQNKQLVLIGDYSEIPEENVWCISIEEASSITISDILSSGYFGVLDENNYYGKNYLIDLALTLRYLNSDGIGKASYYTCKNGVPSIADTDKTYRFVTELQTDRAIFSAEAWGGVALVALGKATILSGDSFFSIDEFNFCQNLISDDCADIDDIKLYDQGIELTHIEAIAETILPEPAQTVLILSHKDLLPLCKRAKKPPVHIELLKSTLRIVSEIDNHDPQYIWLPDFYEIDKIRDGKYINIQIFGKGTLDFCGACIFYDAQNKRVGNPTFSQLNCLYKYEVPKDTKYVKLALRFESCGIIDIEKIVFSINLEQKKAASFLSRSNVLVLTNEYPSPNDLYKHMFVHQRVSLYRDRGFLSDVMNFSINRPKKYREFEGINITDGNVETLKAILESGQIDTVCVHMLNQAMWNVLKQFKNKLRIIVWLHGAEVQPWYRRLFNYSNAEEIEIAQQKSTARVDFWKKIFAEANTCNLHFVFVSDYFMQEVSLDYHLKLPENQYSIIHNCINEDLFTYQEKPPEQRKRILSIRPYASSKYANDLTVKCIEALSRKNFFDDLEFLIIGDGEEFESITESLKKFSNVTLRKQFLTQKEVASLHKEYGIFMCPTRMDSQGVSRDEAMCSGLIPVTNAVAAIPEFVDESCGILASEEDYLEMAAGIERLYYDPGLFERMSENAAKRVRSQTSKAFTIDEEISLIWPEHSA